MNHVEFPIFSTNRSYSCLCVEGFYYLHLGAAQSDTKMGSQLL